MEAAVGYFFPLIILSLMPHRICGLGWKNMSEYPMNLDQYGIPTLCFHIIYVSEIKSFSMFNFILISMLSLLLTKYCELCLYKYRNNIITAIEI